MNDPLITVVIPVYKVEAYLDRCVESVVKQSYEKLEILLVDDGSPDRCGAMCDAWAGKDSRIRVLHQKNAGLGAARNRGTESAAGEFVTYVDSDDYLAPDAIELLLRLLREQGAEIAVADCVKTQEDHVSFDRSSEEHIRLFTGKEACMALQGWELYMPMVTAWGKLFPRELLLREAFTEGRLHEDEATTYRLYAAVSRVALSSRPVYAYYQNPNSIMHTRSERSQRDTLLAYCEQIRFFRSRGETALAEAAEDKLLNVAVDFADRGEVVFGTFLRSEAWQYRSLKTRPKTLVRYYGYRLTGRDFNKLYHKILGR